MWPVRLVSRSPESGIRQEFGQSGLGPVVRLRLQCAGHLPYNRRPCRAAILIRDERSRAQSNAHRSTLMPPLCAEGERYEITI